MTTAVQYNDDRLYGPEFWRHIQALVGTKVDGDPGPLTAAAVERWQEAYNEGKEGDDRLQVDGKVGPATLAAMGLSYTPPPPETRELSEEQIDFIIGLTVAYEGGGKNPYSATNRDGEWRGLFDRPKKDENRRRLTPAERAQRPDHDPQRHSRYGPTPKHIGLSFGAWQFTQDGGALGRVMKRAYELDMHEFLDVFGSDGEQMLEVVQRSGDTGPDGRSPRVQPVAGADLWEEPWLSRFREAGRREFIRQAQRDVIQARYLEPILETIRGYTQRPSQALCAVGFDIAVQFGVGGCRSRIKAAWRGFDVDGDPARAVRRLIARLPQRRQHRRERIAAACERGVRYRLEG